MKVFILLAILASGCALQVSYAESLRSCQFTKAYEVQVINQLPENPDPLRVHCASSDDDLGYHKLTTNQVFKWGFCESFLHNTLFFCHLNWSYHTKAFNVYTSRMRTECKFGVCYWIAREDGIYFNDNFPTGVSSRVYLWE